MIVEITILDRGTKQPVDVVKLNDTIIISLTKITTFTMQEYWWKGLAMKEYILYNDGFFYQQYLEYKASEERKLIKKIDKLINE